LPSAAETGLFDNSSDANIIFSLIYQAFRASQLLATFIYGVGKKSKTSKEARFNVLGNGLSRQKER
jgi:hypothetical protein